MASRADLVESLFRLRKIGAFGGGRLRDRREGSYSQRKRNRQAPRNR
jgi:hypothetical protein